MYSILYPISFELHLLIIEVQSHRPQPARKTFQISIVDVHFATDTIRSHFEVFSFGVLAIDGTFKYSSTAPLLKQVMHL
jgi:hypothetical protein